VRLIARVSLLCLLLGLHGLVLAQSPTGTVSGQVLDPDGRAIAGAEILVVNDLTGLQYAGKSNEDGIYLVTNLPPGPYRIQVSKIGFKALIKPDITLNVQDALSVNFKLPIGAASIVVTVPGGAPLINTENGAVSTVVDRNFVESMPLNGRSFQDLILLTPGVVTVSPQFGAETGQTGEFSVNGQRTESNYYTIDGVSANGGIQPGVPGSLGISGSLPPATALGTTQGLVSVDALEEFRVQSSTYSAEYGRNPGGQFSFATRSGTNQWHGTAFDYGRNDFFDANDWFNGYFGLPKPAERQNDFGGTLGGPIEVPRVYRGKDRSFFFFSYEGLRLVEPQGAVATEVPTSGASGVRVLAPAEIQPVLNAFPLPYCPAKASGCSTDLGNGLGDFVASWSNPDSIDAISMRVDHAVNDRLRLFFRLSSTSSSAVTRGSPAASDVQSLEFTTRSYTFGAASVLSKRLSNELRLNYSTNVGAQAEHLDGFGGARPVNLAQLQGIDTTAHPFYELDVDLSFGNFPGLSQYRYSSSQAQWNLVDTASLLVGRHQLKFGADYRRLAPHLRRQSPFVEYDYPDADALLTNASDFAAALNYSAAYPLYMNFSAFFQDTWRILPRLTLSTGLRWDVNPAPGVTQGLKPYTVQGANNLEAMTLAPVGTTLWQTSWHDVAPRLGAAFIVRNEPGFETVLRGGAGVFYDTGQQNGSFGFYGAGNRAFYVPNAPLSFPAASLSTPPEIVNPPTPPYVIYAFPPHLQLPYTLQTNLSVEQGMGKAQVLTVSYVGAFARKLLADHEVNVAPVNPNFSDVNFLQNGPSSDYNALQTQVQRRLAAGLQVLGSYTLSHCIDYGSVNFLFAYKRGNCDFDVRHNVSSAVSYEPPSRFRRRIARGLLNHWGVDDRFSVRSGFPITFDGASFIDPATGQVQNSGLDLVPNEPTYLYGAQFPGGREVNPNAFALPSSGVGDAPRNFVRGFGAWQMDVAVRREFPLFERLKLQFRAEAFNVFNHPNFGQIDPFFGDATFGQAQHSLAQSLGGLSPLYQMGGPRSLQFALKLVF
jgi:Carboxypeptidase regulatory-like domain/TonB-dependent Receptor Plug Domain/TonB dependent receptor